MDAHGGVTAMAAIMDEAGAILEDEAGLALDDQAGAVPGPGTAGGGRVLRAQDFGAAPLSYEGREWAAAPRPALPDGPWSRA